MKILVREYNSNGELEYVWREVQKKFAGTNTFYTVEGYPYNETQCLKISNDFRKSYGYCRHCNKLVKKGDEEKHFLEKERKIDCFSCRNLRVSPTNNYSKVKYIKQEDGTYMKSSKEEVRLLCNAGYYGEAIEIARENKLSSCPFFKCRRLGVSNFDKTLAMQYPKMFDTLATEASLIDNGFKLLKLDDGDRIYVHKKLKNLRSTVDENGIVKWFQYTYRSEIYKFIYAKAYDKFFSVKYSAFNYLSFNWNMSDTTVSNIYETVKNVYKEEK